ncbi:MAG: DHH family phosphoesterase [Patescibacteria group bacterium]|jgi:phosphoesterase RecJ-like protein
MMLSPKEQIYENVKKSQNILICIPKDPTTDAVAAGLALFSVLEKLDKKAKVVCSEFTLPPHNQFLPKSKEIVSDLTSLRKFIISLDVSRTKVEELSYDIKNDQLDIYITPKDGTFRDKDVRLSSSDFEYDLIFVLDAPDLDTLGKLYENNTEFFYHTPIINIDHNPANDNFGQINLVDLTATSSSEIIFELVKDWKEDILDEYNATSLLAGIISKTKSFQTSSVTPRSLAIASHLISSGARREEIIRHLYQTKSVETLKLWGRALAKLKQDKDNKIVWSVLSVDDFAKSGSYSEEDVLSVIDELIIDAPDAEIIIILYEQTKGDYRAIISTPSTIDALMIFKEYSPVGTKDFTRITVQAADLDNAEQIVLNTIQTALNIK